MDKHNSNLTAWSVEVVDGSERSRLHTITPEPKYLAKSNTVAGIASDVRLARTGNSVPAVPPIQMMKTEAMRRPVKLAEPPPEPQLSASDMILHGFYGSSGKGARAGTAQAACQAPIRPLCVYILGASAAVPVSVIDCERSRKFAPRRNIIDGGTK